MSDVRFFFMNQDFEVTKMLDNYESLNWIERYDEPGEFEVFTYPSAELLEAAQTDNYILRTGSDELMIIEAVGVSTEFNGGPKISIKGRSLSSILDRRIVLCDTYIRHGMWDSFKQLLNWAFINPRDQYNQDAPERKIDNFIYEELPEEDPLRDIQIDNFEFSDGTTILEIIEKCCKANKVGFKIYLNDAKQFVFKIYRGQNRAYGQHENPYVIFSSKFNNLISTTRRYDQSAMKNVVYCRGEEKDDDSTPEPDPGGDTPQPSPEPSPEPTPDPDPVFAGDWVLILADGARIWNLAKNDEAQDNPTRHEFVSFSSVSRYVFDNNLYEVQASLLGHIYYTWDISKVEVVEESDGTWHIILDEREKADPTPSYPNPFDTGTYNMWFSDDSSDRKVSGVSVASNGYWYDPDLVKVIIEVRASKHLTGITYRNYLQHVTFRRNGQILLTFYNGRTEGYRTEGSAYISKFLFDPPAT